MKLPEITAPTMLDDQETTINILRTDDTLELYTADSTMVTKLNKFVKNFPDVYKFRQGEYGSGVFYTFPKNLLSFRSPPSEAMIQNGKRLAALRKEQIDEENT